MASEQEALALSDGLGAVSSVKRAAEHAMKKLRQTRAACEVEWTCIHHGRQGCDLSHAALHPAPGGTTPPGWCFVPEAGSFTCRRDPMGSGSRTRRQRELSGAESKLALLTVPRPHACPCR